LGLFYEVELSDGINYSPLHCGNKGGINVDLGIVYPGHSLHF